MRAGAAILVLALQMLIAAVPAAANTIIVQLVPGFDPAAVVYCSMHLEAGKISAIAAKGMGLQDPRPVRWWANSAEVDAVMHSLAGFLTGDIPSQNPLLAPLLQPPFLTVDWFAKSDGSLASGRYQQAGTTLPAALQRLIATVMPGSYCAQDLNG